MEFTFYQQHFMLNFHTTNNISVNAMKAINIIPGLNSERWKNVCEKLSIISFPLRSHYVGICEKQQFRGSFPMFRPRDEYKIYS
jgi:hypothetical protein